MKAGTDIFPRPALAARYLERVVSSPNRALSIFGPRQVGKTTLLQHDVRHLAETRGLRTLYVDFMATEDALELLNARLAQLVHDERLRLPARRVKSAKLGPVGIDLESVPVDPSSSNAGVQLQNAFAALNRLVPGVRVLFMLDEAQELVKHRDGEPTMKAIRSLFNTFAGQVLLLITGSSRDGLLRLFGDRHRASFGLADHEDFLLLGREFVEAMGGRLNAQRKEPIPIDELVDAFDLMERRPADLLAFLQFLALHPVRNVVGSVKPFLQSRYPMEAVKERFGRFTPLQQAALRLLANGQRQITGKAAGDRIAEMLGARVTASGVRQAIVSLPPDVLSNPSRGHYEIVDVRLLAWLQERSE